MSYQELTKGRHSETGQDYFVTFTTKDRKPFLSNHMAAIIVARTMHYHKSINCFAWVIMPDHVHILMTLKTGNLSDNIMSIKGRSSHQINQCSVPFKWAKGYYDHALRKEEAREQIARYIVANPLRAKLVKKLADYPWWNAVYL